MKMLSSNLIKIKDSAVKYAFILLVAVGFAACENDVDNTDIDSAELEAEALVEVEFEDLDDIVSESMIIADASAGGKVQMPDDDRLDCATISHNPEEKTITIEFAADCEDPRGNVRSGKIIITYTGRRFIPGSVITFVLENFVVNGKLVEGTRIIENITDANGDLLGAPTFNIKLVGGKITSEDGVVATRDFEKVRKWVRAANPLDDEFEVTGSGNGTRAGQEYSVTIIERLLWKRRCHLQGVFIPVAGIKEVVRGGEVYIVNYGDGDCDNIITVTHNGRSKEIDLTPKRKNS